MVSRRELLLTGVCLGLPLYSRKADAAIAVILAAIAAVTVLAEATAKVAATIEEAISAGVSLSRKINELHKQNVARAELEDRISKIRATLVSGEQTQHMNALLINEISWYISYPSIRNWHNVTSRLTTTENALRDMADLFRLNAILFPSEAQEAVAALPGLAMQRALYVSELAKLSDLDPPTAPEQLQALTHLVTEYDRLRYQSLRLLIGLREYVTR
jgi:hypothetical protein